jgi:alpha-1,2-mannosyltransferase
MAARLSTNRISLLPMDLQASIGQFHGRVTLAFARRRSDLIFAAITFCSLAYFSVFMAVYIGGAHPPFDATGYPIGRDFVNTWMSGRAVFGGHPALWFDHRVYNEALRPLFGLPANFPWYNWSYPPHILLFTWAFGLLPYMPAWILWTIAGFAAYFFTATQGEWRQVRLMFLAAWPAGIVNYFCGQNGFFTAALLIGGLMQLEKRPVLAGVLFGLLTLKPQLGLLLPIMLVLTRNWRCIASALATLLVLIGITSAIFGTDIWGAYFHVAVPTQDRIFETLVGWATKAMPTAFMDARFFNASPKIAWLVQAPVSLASFAAVVWTFWRKRDPLLSIALLVSASFLFTPYVWVYDMVVFGWLIAKLRERDDNTLIDDCAALGIWALPIMALPLPNYSGIPAFSIFLMIFMVRLLWRLHHDGAPLKARST